MIAIQWIYIRYIYLGEYSILVDLVRAHTSKFL